MEIFDNTVNLLNYTPFGGLVTDRVSFDHIPHNLRWLRYEVTTASEDAQVEGSLLVLFLDPDLLTVRLYLTEKYFFL